MTKNLSKEYREHVVFNQLEEYADFYKSLSFHIMSWIRGGTRSAINLDTYVYSSIQGTLESIKLILTDGRINDAYALLRKYYDSTIINIYTNLYLSDNFSLDNLIVSKIDNWIKGKEKLPEYRVMSQYIGKSDVAKPIYSLLQKDKRYRKIRNLCNDHTHYNYYHNVLSNDSEIHFPERIKLIDNYSFSLEAVFIQHISYIFYINEHFMRSSDYLDSLEVGMTPSEESLFWVAPFVQDIFNSTLKFKRPDIAEEIKNHTKMRLE